MSGDCVLSGPFADRLEGEVPCSFHRCWHKVEPPKERWYVLEAPSSDNDSHD